MNGRERVMAALRHEPVDRTPVWFMRQAGRHLPEYRALAEQADFWERCKNLDLCTTITAQPIERYPQLDAAIVFSDILTPLPALGYEVEYGGGIRITPFTFDDLEAWPEFEARTHAPWAANALAALPEVLPRDVARLGFAGCPWTVGMYLIAGGTGDKEFVNTRAKVHADPEAAMRLFLRLGDIVGNLLADQVVHGGADAVQLFDTWGRFARRSHLPTLRHARHREGHRRVPSEMPNANPAHPLRQGLGPPSRRHHGTRHRRLVARLARRPPCLSSVAREAVGPARQPRSNLHARLNRSRGQRCGSGA